MSATVLAVAAPTATARGTYDVVSCQFEQQLVPPTAWEASFSGWASQDEGRWPMPTGHQCAAFGFGVDFADAVAHGPLKAAWTFAAPADTSIVAFSMRPIGAHFGVGFAADEAFAYALRDGTGRALEQSPAGANGWSLFGGDRQFKDLDTAGLSLEMTCPAGRRCGSDSSAAIAMNHFHLTLRDVQAPAFRRSPTRSSEGAVDAAFADAGGGVKSASLVIGDAIVETISFCQAPFAARVPCRSEGSVRFATKQPSPVAVELVDAAGNRTRASASDGGSE